jgi:hypothetical protein
MTNELLGKIVIGEGIGIIICMIIIFVNLRRRK